MKGIVKYPIGQQDFETLRELGYLYVDKTRFIKQLLEGGLYFFLARPRRFGKSLFLSTLRYFFEGRRELFKGLYIDSVDWNWERYPVLRLDLNIGRYSEPGMLDQFLDNLFMEWESKYQVKSISEDLSLRFRNIIEAAHKKTGHKVVILVDEYDKPLVGNLNNQKNFEHYRSKLASVYSNFKSSADHICLVFLTGVSRFSKLSVFSDLNNLKDITFSDEYADICGITEKELIENFTTGIEKLAVKLGISYDDARVLLKRNYDGYRFSGDGSDIYNPWSVLNAMYDSEIANFWNETGMPTILAEALKRINADLEKTFDTYCSRKDLTGMDLLDPRVLPLLYQTGYLTIKEYIPKLDRYRLGIPNREVKDGFFHVLVPYYLKYKSHVTNDVINNMVIAFILGNPEDAMKAMQTYFAGIDYSLKIENDNNFHNAFFLLIDIIGLETQAESHTSDGRIDIEIKTEDFIYVIELKYDGSAEDAIRQIDEKRYDRKYQMDTRKIFRIGVNFSSSTRCIENWIIN